MGDGKLPVSIDTRRLAQCPTGYLKPEDRAWVDEFYRIKTVGKATNSPLFASIAEADPLTVSVFELLERENNYIDNQIQEARSRQSG
jgi:hypothetical protein